MKPASLAIASGLVLTTSAVFAQPATLQVARPCANASTDNVHAFVLKNAASQVDANEEFTALRNMLSAENKLYFLPSQNTIFVCGTPEQIALAQKMVSEVDKPKKLFRLTYTVTEMDGTKVVETHHYSMVAVSGQQTTLKQGSRVPVITGSYDQAKSEQQTQFTYIDVGMNFDATVTEVASGILLRATVEQSSVAEEKSISSVQEPVVRQTVLKGSSYVSPGKPLLLGSVDVAGSTHRLEVQVTMEPLP
jgi:type II secretory pathway component GspD/PulD (secretin)